MLKEISVDLFMQRAASSTPIPNGSSIAALAGAQAAALSAVKVTFRSAWDCLRILFLINDVAAKGNLELTPDLGVANLQSYSGAVGTCYSLNKNLEYIKDSERAAEYRQEADSTLKVALRL